MLRFFQNIRCRDFGRPLVFMIMAVLLLSVNAASAQRPAAAEKSILVFGDSLVSGYGLPLDKAFPAQLDAKLSQSGIAAKVINAGVSGSTTADGLNRLEWTLKQTHPDYAIVVLGGNDMLRAVNPPVTYDNLQKILGVFKAHKIPVLLAGMRAFSNLGPSFDKAYQVMYKQAAADYGAVFYPFFLEGVALHPGLLLQDGVHPTADGVAIIVTKIMPFVQALLKK